MRITNVIKARRWKNTKTGQTASLYGAIPWTSDVEQPNWELDTVGYTWQMSDGRIGFGRKPAKTEAEALEIMDKINNR